MAQSPNLTITTLGQLKASGYRPKSIKEELRDNLIARMRDGADMFPGVIGYEDTVIPDMQRAILSRHNMILLGLRGQAKTRIARQMVGLLDEYIPVVAGSELNDDPLLPISRFAKDLIEEHGDDTPVEWLHRNDRYVEKLATPDVTVADLIGDVDPIKAATLKLPYSDERTIHFGLIPRSHRCLFVINELPDLQPRIQVALFNILQEGDIQIRGFSLRLPMDVQFVFTANPEDYTNRGSIVTPLKDRIESQILTHYPKSLQLSMKITQQEARIAEGQQESVIVDELCARLVEEIAIEARQSEYVDEKSGVSARMTITAFENLSSAVERRVILNDEAHGYSRVGDLVGVVPSITGKIELVYEGEQEGPAIVAQKLISKAIRNTFTDYFPDPESIKRSSPENPYRDLTQWFTQGNVVDLLNDMSDEEYRSSLRSIPGLTDIVNHFHKDISEQERYLLMEFVLHGLAEYSLVGKSGLEKGLQFKDLLSGMFNMPDDDDEGDFGGYYENRG
ncbi:magnesium chelatase [Pontibacter sp. G13]|uniref:magnesium chelatase n=1 Tax=Pontibacter sp. G13 TaxID=3074898 RepID=UPI00288B46AF|nr:magnesium chelatase [Pontibacter sp. G13]WNJ20865.1 magnesium chelatase [Pontibacter sp. G13]